MAANVESVISHLAKSWSGGSEWLKPFLGEMFTHYSELRNNIVPHSSSWNDSEYCEYLAYHYYNLALCYYRLFHKYTVDLASLNTWIIKCLDTIAKIPKEVSANKMSILESDAKRMFAVVSKVIDTQQKHLIYSKDVMQSSVNSQLKFVQRCVVLGNLAECEQIVLVLEVSNQQQKLLHQQVQSIHLIRAINTLEEALAVSTLPDAWTSAEQYECLGQAYQLAGHPALGGRYVQTARHLFESCLKEVEVPHILKQDVDGIIENEIAKFQSTLKTVKSLISEANGVNLQLAFIDRAYIEQKYADFCMELCLNEVMSCIMELAACKSRAAIQGICYSLITVEDLNQIPFPFNQLNYYQLLVKQKLMKRENYNIFIAKLQALCVDRVLDYNKSAKQEWIFLESLVNFICSSNSYQSRIDQLQLQKVCQGNVPISILTKLILELDVTQDNNDAIFLKECAHYSKTEDFLLNDMFMEIIRECIKPAEVKEIVVDGRLVVEVVGKTIVISEVVQELEETILKNSSIEEVRFVGAEVVHIDRNLGGKTWHGRSIIILTKKVKIYGKIIWNVSGKTSSRFYARRALDGKKIGESGENGKDGCAGESGGNVLIWTETADNLQNLTIISHGGCGSSGQDGGIGQDGKCGTGITREDFGITCPFFSKNIISLKTIKNTVERISHNINNLELLRENLIQWKSDEDQLSDLFINAITKEGNVITFSYGAEDMCHQTFLLYAGTPGQPAGQGGEYGLGGQGGYGGDIMVRNPNDSRQEFNIVTSAKAGEDGRRGQGGLHGCPGHNGWDMGLAVTLTCTDQQTSSIPPITKWKQHSYPYGRNQNSKLKLSFHATKTPERIWCPYQNHLKRANQYAEITSFPLKNKDEMTDNRKNDKRLNNEPQHQAKAIRKKAVCLESISSHYCRHSSSMTSVFLNKDHLNLVETRNRALQGIIDMKKQGMLLSTEPPLKCLDHKIIECTYSVTSGSLAPKQHNFEHLLSELKQNSNSLNNWLQLKNLELSVGELNRLFDISCIMVKLPRSHALQSEVDPAKDEIILLPSFEQLLIEKCRLNALKEIAVKLNSVHHIQTFNIGLELSAHEAMKCLVECNEFDTNTCSNLLCILNRRSSKLKSDHLKYIAKFDKQLKTATENSKLKNHTMKMFISEASSSVKVIPSLKHHFINYERHLEEQNRNLSVIFKCFKFAVQMWDIKNDYMEKTLNEKLITSSFLKHVYKRFSEQLQLQYNLNHYYKDPNVVEEYSKHIEQKDPSSAIYRELLAYLFDINIRLYIRYKGNLGLQNDHNPQAKEIVHILLTDSKFIQLKFDQEYLALAFEHLQKGVLFTKILSETESFKSKHQFDMYLSVQPFLSSKYLDCPLSKPVTAVDHIHCVVQEDVIGQITKYFLPPIQKREVKLRLDKIMSYYIGPHKILQGILKRFTSEGRHVSYEEFEFLLGYILVSAVDKQTELSIICWIISTCPQKKWSCELLLLELELYFRKHLSEKAKWRDYLSIVDNYEIILLFLKKLGSRSRKHISIQCIGDILHLLSETSHQSIYVVELDLTEWVLALKVPYWISKLLKLFPSSRWNQGELEVATHYLLSLENAMEFSVVDQFVNFLSRKDTPLTPKEVVGILSHFYSEEWFMSQQMFDILSSEKVTIGEWKTEMDKKYQTCGKDRDITQLVELIAANIHTSKQIIEKLPQIKQSIENINSKNYPHTEHKRSILKTNDESKPISSFTEDDVKTWVATMKGPRETPKIEEKLAVIDRAIEIKRGFKLRDTQKFAIMTLLTNEGNTLAQVSSGEGKSLIVLAMSIVKVLCGEKVDVITSSSVSAKCSASANRDIYQMFGITVSHNCSENADERRAAYSRSQVIYGDISNFQRDYLLDRFHDNNILGDRNFKNVIVDEVDSMLLDLDHNVLYLSHDLCGFERLECMYIYIWQCLNCPGANSDKLVSVLSTAAIKEAVIEELYGFIKREDLKTLDSQLDSLQVNALWESLINLEIINSRGSILKGSIENTKLMDLLPSVFCSLGDRLMYLLKGHIEREKHIIVPNYLKPFIEEHVETWINNAKSAMIMEYGHDYIVDIDRAGSGKELEPKITILDQNTGTDKWNCQWADGLHQFLQLKHGCKLSVQSLKAVFISNVSYFKKYEHLYGLVGPFRLQLERTSLIDIYGINFVAIPAAQTKHFVEETPTFCATKVDWIKEIIEKVNKVIGSINQRSALVLCETVNDVETLYQAFVGVNSDHVIAYTRERDEICVSEGNKILTQGQVIISTNLALYGVSLKLANNLKNAGGLHVCLTYLPKYHRITQQAFGRAARPGERGSGQLIIIRPEIKRDSRYKSLQTESYIQELQLLSQMVIHFKTQTAYLEDCLKQFKTLYKQLSNNLTENNAPTEVKDIMLHSIVDRWAFWLDGNECHNRIPLGKFLTELKKLKAVNSLDWPAWTCVPMQAIKLGKYLSEHKKYDEAIALFNRVIDKEPLFCEAAHYYKAFALVKKTSLKEKAAKEEFKKELLDAAQLLDKRIEFSFRAASIVETMKQCVPCNFIQVDSFKEQQFSICKLYYGFLQSITDVLGHYATPQSFVTTGVGVPLAELIYRGLLTDGILKNPIIHNYVKEDALHLISNGYGLSVDTLNAVLLKLKGTEIHVHNTREFLKKEMALPSREGFWNDLIDKKILIEETRYIIINNNKLKVIDPSLLRLVDEMLVARQLCKYSLCSKDPKHLFLYAVEDNEKSTILKKIEFLDIVGQDKYNALKTSGVVSCNKKACIDSSNINGEVHLSYDSIKVQDFLSINIAEQEAKVILHELVLQKIVEQDNNVTNKYCLVGKINNLELYSYPLYENAVKGLLTIHCIYKIALQNVLNQLNEDQSPIEIPLISKPYDNFIWDLINVGVLSPVVVNTKSLDNLQVKLKNKYSLTMDENEFKLFLSESQLIPKQELTRKLRDHLVEKKWISKTLKVAKKPCVFKSSQGWYQYTINQNAEHQSLGQSYKKIEETLHCIFDNRLHLAKETTIENIYHILYGLKSELKSLNVQSCVLKPVIDLTPPSESTQLYAVDSLACNCLNQYIICEEKEVWSCNWHFNTTVEIAFGVTQSALSTVRELDSIGVLTLGKHSINKGVGDLLFEAEALHSRCSYWRAYEQHKLINMFTDAVTYGLSLSSCRGVKVRNVGHKIVSPFYEIETKVYSKMAEGISRQNSMKEFKQNICIEVVKCARLKAIEMLTFGLRNLSVKTVIENCCHTLCFDMSSRIFSNIEVELEKNIDLSTNLNQMFCNLEQDMLHELVYALTQKYFTNSYNTEKWRTSARKVADDVLKGINNTLKMKTKIAGTVSLDNFVKEVITYPKGYKYLDNNVLMAGDFLSYLNHEINNKNKSEQVGKNKGVDRRNCGDKEKCKDNANADNSKDINQDDCDKDDGNKDDDQDGDDKDDGNDTENCTKDNENADSSKDGSQDDCTQDDCTQDDCTQDDCTQDDCTQDDCDQDDGEQDDGDQDDVNQDEGDKGEGDKDEGNKDEGNKDNGDQDNGIQDNGDQVDCVQDDENDNENCTSKKCKDNDNADGDTHKQFKYEGVVNEMYITGKVIFDMLRMLLNREASHIISQDIVKPILQQTSILLHTDCAKTVRRQYGSYQEKRYTACLTKRKEANYCDSHQISLPTRDEQYCRSVLRLMAKTPSSKLLATIIKENIPMDMKCIQAVMAVIPEVLKRVGIVFEKVAVVVEGEDGTRQDFFSCGTERVIILKLSGREEKIEWSAAGCHELFSALAKQIPELWLNTTAEIFQTLLANCIEQSSITEAIKKNWDQFSFQNMPYDHEDACSSCFATSSGSTEFTNTLLLYIKTTRRELHQNCSFQGCSIPFRDRSRRNSC